MEKLYLDTELQNCESLLPVCDVLTQKVQFRFF